jgi:NAD(P)-dependent dehydrogenase (short-subunit alcohol dehydrogenase family)
MTTRLQGRVALVTGAQQGIGKASALALAQAGADVVVNYFDDEASAAAIVAEIEACGRRATSVRGNVSDEHDIARMLDATHTLGGIDILVNNAGIFPRVAFLDMTSSEWDAVLGVNLKGTFLCSQAAAKQMIGASKPGAIVNITSVAALRGSPRGTHYVASKAGIIGLTRASALELAEHHVRVNAVAPGLTDTAQPRDGMTEAQIADTAAAIPLGGITRPEDIANMVVFLASEEARQMTGQTVSVNGGQYLY